MDPLDEAAPAAPPHPARAWAFFAGIAGALGACALSVKGLLSSGGSAAAVGYVFVPFIAIAVAVLAGTWGLALGTVVTHHRGVRAALRPVLVMAWVVSVAAPTVVAWEAATGLALQREVRALATLDAAGLDAAQAGSRFRDNKFFLGALAQHPAARPELLARIAARPDPELRESMGSVWDVMGANREGASVLRLVARHPSTPQEVLRLLAADEDARLAGEAAQALRRPAKPGSPG